MDKTNIVEIRRQEPYSSHTAAVRGRKVWISGAANGLGFLFAKALMCNGCSSLAIADICAPEIGEAATRKLAEVASLPDASVIFFQCDVRDKHRVAETMRLAAEEFCGLDTVVNNAGFANEAKLEETIAINLTALITATEAALHRLVLEQSRPSHDDVVIVNIGSAGGVFNIPIAPYYCASKHGVVGYTKSMRDKCAGNQVRINCFCPGWVNVGMGSSASKNSTSTKFTGILDEETLVFTFLELFRRTDLYGEAVYISEVSGARISKADISIKLDDWHPRDGLVGKL